MIRPFLAKELLEILIHLCARFLSEISKVMLINHSQYQYHSWSRLINLNKNALWPKINHVNLSSYRLEKIIRNRQPRTQLTLTKVKFHQSKATDNKQMSTKVRTTHLISLSNKTHIANSNKLVVHFNENQELTILEIWRTSTFQVMARDLLDHLASKRLSKS